MAANYAASDGQIVGLASDLDPVEEPRVHLDPPDEAAAVTATEPDGILDPRLGRPRQLDLDEVEIERLRIVSAFEWLVH